MNRLTPMALPWEIKSNAVSHSWKLGTAVIAAGVVLSPSIGHAQSATNVLLPLSTTPPHQVVITGLPSTATRTDPAAGAVAPVTTTLTIGPTKGNDPSIAIPKTAPAQVIKFIGLPPGQMVYQSETDASGAMPETTTISLGTPSSVEACNSTASFTNDCLSNWGFGVGIGEFFYGNADIRSAELETVTVPGPNGTTISQSVVRVTESHKREASIWAEMHYVWPVFYLPNPPVHLGILDFSFLSAWHIGPFAAVQIGGTTGVFDSLALGVMNSFPISQSSNQAFGIGLGYGWTQVQLLGDDIVANQPLPAGVTNIRYLKRDIGGPVIMLSYHFR